MSRRIQGLTVAVLVLLAVCGAPAAATEFPAAPGTAAVRTYRTTVGTDPATVYYPAGLGHLPVALLLQGANVRGAEYSVFARGVARYGFAVAVPDHVGSYHGGTGLYATEWEVNGGAAWAVHEQHRAGSPLAGRIDADRFVLLGHSFGAGAGLFAVGNVCTPPFCFATGYRRPGTLRAAAFYGSAGAVAGGASAPQIDNTGVPVALVHGELDGVIPHSAGVAFYGGLRRSPKALVTVLGANHYGVTDEQDPSGAKPDPSRQTINQRRGVADIARWCALFLRASLGDRLAESYVYRFDDVLDPDVTVRAHNH
jgi:dienelactone hydrolase